MPAAARSTSTHVVPDDAAAAAAVWPVAHRCTSMSPDSGGVPVR